MTPQHSHSYTVGASRNSNGSYLSAATTEPSTNGHRHRQSQHHGEESSVIHSSLVSGVHGRERRVQRNISKVDLKNARRYGMQEEGNFGRKKYTYGGVVFIYDEVKNQEVTSFKAPDFASAKSGTLCAKPLHLERRELTKQEEEAYKVTARRMRQNKDVWTSHSVLVVDMSGSMRRDDVNGARCRADGVWIALARDFVQQQIQTNRCTTKDVVSVVFMQERSRILCRFLPMGWPLYNSFLNCREWSQAKPVGPGNYLPALDMAESLLDVNPHGSCSLSLLFFSDGKPSDKGEFVERMGKIGAKYGRRLTVSCIGMADEKEDFSMLECMATEAENYGALATFNKPSLSTDSLSNIITSLVTSLNTSKTEMTDLKSGKTRCVRSDLLRERRGAPDDESLTEDWRTFSLQSETSYVRNFWTWSYNQRDFVGLLDPRCIECFRLVVDSVTFDNSDSQRGILCPRCKACFICSRCCLVADNHRQDVRRGECANFLKQRRTDRLIQQSVPSFAIAIKNLVYGEGAERIVFKARFLDAEDKFIGPKMVAKESRFVEDHGSYQDRMNYHREFLRTQSLASEFADKYNAQLDELKNHFRATDHAFLKRLPRIQFLKPLVVELVKDDGKEWNVLVEEFLEGQYTKFNSNNGHVRNQTPLEQAFADLNIANNLGDTGGDLEAIVEESEEEEEEESSDEEFFDDKQRPPIHGVYSKLRDEDFPQAFSHFTHETSKGKLMVVDLQGVFQIKENGEKLYKLTDPAIHKRKKTRKDNRPLKSGWMSFGRTDRGQSGMNRFFDTHVCTDACRLLGLHEYKKRQR